MNLKKLSTQQIHAIDQAHVWHPYSSLSQPLPTYHVTSASGVRLQLGDGGELIDGMSSWWCAIHGYNHPQLNEAVTTQLAKMSHVMFGGIIHEPAAQLAQRLVDMTPEPLNKVFFSDSGSVSVEIAIKMALQFWQAKGHAVKNKLLSLRKGYHGDPFTAMSVCDPKTGMHQPLTEVLHPHVFREAP